MLTLDPIDVVTEVDGPWRRGPQQGLQRVDVPAPLGVAFSAVTTRRLHRQRALVHGAVVLAARLAHEDPAGTGARALLADPESLGSLDQDRRRRVSWVQDDAEYAECARRIESRGSSVPAVIRTWIAAYLAVDGDLLDPGIPGGAGA